MSVELEIVARHEGGCVNADKIGEVIRLLGGNVPTEAEVIYRRGKVVLAHFVSAAEAGESVIEHISRTVSEARSKRDRYLEEQYLATRPNFQAPAPEGV